MGLEEQLWTKMPIEKFVEVVCPECEKKADLTYTGDFKDTYYYVCSNCNNQKVSGSSIMMHNRALKEKGDYHRR